jgi:CDP-diacylglycerol--serine O-phosphatidyltransferase
LVIGLIWSVVDASESQGVAPARWANAAAYAITMFAGLSMVTNAPFYSFKVFDKRSVPFIVLVGIMLCIGLVAMYPAQVLFVAFCAYGVSGYVIYAYRKAKGKPVSVISTSTDEPDERGLHDG